MTELKKKEEKICHTIEFPIKSVEGYQHPRDAFDKNFHYLQIIHNACVKEANRRLELLFRDKQYKVAKQKYARYSKEIEAQNNLIKAKNEQIKKADKERAKALKEEIAECKERLKAVEEKRKATTVVMKEKTAQYDLKGSYFLGKWVKTIQKKYKNYITSMQAAAEAQRVWVGVEKVLYKNGEKIHYKKYNEMNSVTQSTDDNGVVFDIETGNGRWGLKDTGKRFHVDIDWDDEYTTESIVGNKLKYCEIKRRMFKSGYRYYLVLVLTGPAPKTISDLERKEKQEGNVGVRINLTNVSYVTDESVSKVNLAKEADKYEKEIAALQRGIDRSIRLSNPDNFNADGTAKKGKREWYYSKRVKTDRRKISELNRKKSDYVKISHNTQINEIIKKAENIQYQIVDVQKAARKKKKTERNNYPSPVTNKKGETKMVYKFKKKRKQGKTVGTYAPAGFAVELENHAKKYGIPVTKISDKQLNVYQYDANTNKEFSEVNVSKYRNIGEVSVNRDVAAAFVIKNIDADSKEINIKEPEIKKLEEAVKRG